MADPKYLYGNNRPRNATIATAQAVAGGDIVGMAAGTLVRAEDQAWDTDTATTQAAFRLLFLGISQQTKAAAVARPYGNSADNVCAVATGGVFEFDCASATFEVGARVGPAKASGNALLSNKVVAVASDALMIGRVVERGTSITRVKVEILSALQPAAAQA